jgi:hypothetical protein
VLTSDFPLIDFRLHLSGIPWEDPPSTGSNPLVADAVVLSYVSNYQFQADTVEDYNNYDQKNNCARNECSLDGNPTIGINVGGDTYLPVDFPIFMYEYGWTSYGWSGSNGDYNLGKGGPGPGFSSGYYVGILDYNNDTGLGYFLTNQTDNILSGCQKSNEGVFCPYGYYDYYYSGSGYYSSQGSGGGTDRNAPLYYYFVEDNTGSITGYNGGTTPIPFIPPDQQDNSKYYQFGVFWLYNWFLSPPNNPYINIYFLMNGNIFNYFLASVQYTVDRQQVYAIPPNPPASTIN